MNAVSKRPGGFSQSFCFWVDAGKLRHVPGKLRRNAGILRRNTGKLRHTPGKLRH